MRSPRRSPRRHAAARGSPRRSTGGRRGAGDPPRPRHPRGPSLSDQLAEAGVRPLEGDGAVKRDPVEKLSFGWHFMKLTGLEEAGIAPFEAVRGGHQQELAAGPWRSTRSSRWPTSWQDEVGRRARRGSRRPMPWASIRFDVPGGLARERARSAATPRWPDLGVRPEEQVIGDPRFRPPRRCELAPMQETREVRPSTSSGFDGA